MKIKEMIECVRSAHGGKESLEISDGVIKAIHFLTRIDDIIPEGYELNNENWACSTPKDGKDVTIAFGAHKIRPQFPDGTLVASDNSTPATVCNNGTELRWIASGVILEIDATINPRLATMTDVDVLEDAMQDDCDCKHLHWIIPVYRNLVRAQEAEK